ncbi:hypothetical protein [Microbacterium aquimaris]|uniref:Integral membrane protein n=1 Tax=Microbacterium aquimaris TaxID=459816 RepID=A0ABU5N2E8_9MICO|nr:hypothetical protein [Microbacterium aquimaris]MDZ8160255.1 hypothetical protein [Microbacterium aquimaris]
MISRESDSPGVIRSGAIGLAAQIAAFAMYWTAVAVLRPGTVPLDGVAILAALVGVYLIVVVAVLRLCNRSLSIAGTLWIPVGGILIATAAAVLSSEYGIASLVPAMTILAPPFLVWALLWSVLHQVVLRRKTTRH